MERPSTREPGHAGRGHPVADVGVEVDPALDPWRAAVRLAAVTEGLALQVYRDPGGVRGIPAAELVDSVLAAELALVFTGECRQYADRP